VLTPKFVIRQDSELVLSTSHPHIVSNIQLNVIVHFLGPLSRHLLRPCSPNFNTHSSTNKPVY